MEGGFSTIPLILKLEDQENKESFCLCFLKIHSTRANSRKKSAGELPKNPEKTLLGHT